MMTMHKLAEKLRRNNRERYRILGLCIFLSVLLVSSFSLMFFSPSVQVSLPPGGDTRKLMWLMLGVVALGCLLFTLYGSGLFFRRKSREFGVLLALGAGRETLARQLFGELAAVAGSYGLAGILLAVPASWLIFQFFQTLVIRTAQMEYRPGLAGVLTGLGFAAGLSACVLILGIRFIRRTDIMDVLNAGRRTEMVRTIRPWTGKLGAALVILGLFLAMAVPQLTVRVFHQGMPGLWNATYLLCAAGLYLVMLSAVAQSEKGRRPQRYYRNIISVNLMRFTARQTTRNMCVIALLVFVMVLAAFWGVMYYYSATEGGSEAPYDYTMHWPARERQIGQQETEALAEEYGIRITAYEELETLELVIRYTGRDMDDSRRYFDVEYEKLASFVSAEDYERISGTPVSLREGEYLTVTSTGYRETIWVSADCLSSIENPVTEEKLAPVYAGTVECDNLALYSDPFAFVLSEKDYDRLAAGLAEEYREKYMLFCVDDLMETYAFAEAWKQACIARATELSDHYALYDAWEEKLALEAGESYSYTGSIGLSPDNPRLMAEWKYRPFSKVLMQADAMELVAVFVLLSIYISVIALASAGMMSYVRSVTIAMDNRQLFEDLRKLGADDAYEERVIRVQLRRIFVYPVAAGCAVTGMFSLLMMYFNDLALQRFEVRMLLMEGGLMCLIAAVMYAVYKMAYGRTKEIVGITSVDRESESSPVRL